MNTGASRKKQLFIGPSADWVEDDVDATLAHTKHEVARQLIARLKVRIEALRATDLPMETVATEMRRQMSECAVDGNLLLASELGEAVWALLQEPRNEDSLSSM